VQKADVYQADDEEAIMMRARLTKAANRARAYAELTKDLKPGEDPFVGDRRRKQARPSDTRESTPDALATVDEIRVSIVEDFPTEETFHGDAAPLDQADESTEKADPGRSYQPEPRALARPRRETTGFHLLRGTVHLKTWHLAALAGAMTIVVSALVLRAVGVRAEEREPNVSLVDPASAAGPTRREESPIGARVGSATSPPAIAADEPRREASPAPTATGAKEAPLQRAPVEVESPKSRRVERARPSRDPFASRGNTAGAPSAAPVSAVRRDVAAPSPDPHDPPLPDGIDHPHF
jgi:hypothetical protein